MNASWGLGSIACSHTTPPDARSIAASRGPEATTTTVEPISGAEGLGASKGVTQ
jgi:hypothetical protein